MKNFFKILNTIVLWLVIFFVFAGKGLSSNSSNSENAGAFTSSILVASLFTWIYWKYVVNRKKN